MNSKIAYKKPAALISLLFASFAFWGCADNDVEDAVDATEDAARDAADEVEDAAEKVADDIKDATN